MPRPILAPYFPPNLVEVSAAGDDEIGELRFTLEEAAYEHGLPLKDLTVLTNTTDPFRLDTPANRSLSKWFADNMQKLLPGRKIHPRGAHYSLFGIPKPNGEDYSGSDADYQWLSKVVKTARWLAYIPFKQILDERSEEAIIRDAPWSHKPDYKELSVHGGIERPYIPSCELEVPRIELSAPRVTLASTSAGTPRLILPTQALIPPQAHRVALMGEKSSLHMVLDDVAEEFGTDLLLCTGEASETRVYELAYAASADGRMVIVLWFGDHDPRGWNMPISVARKLQAHRVHWMPRLRFKVFRAALLPEHVKAFGLNEFATQMKSEETLAKAWLRRLQAWGYDAKALAEGKGQIEIDAMVGRFPDQLTQIAKNAIAPFYDPTLDRRARSVHLQWQAEMRTWFEKLPEYSDACEFLRQAHAALEPKLEEACKAIEDSYDSIQQELEQVHDRIEELYGPIAGEVEDQVDVMKDAVNEFEKAQETSLEELKLVIETDSGKPEPPEEVKPALDDPEHEPICTMDSDADFVSATQDMIADKIRAMPGDNPKRRRGGEEEE